MKMTNIIKKNLISRNLGQAVNIRDNKGLFKSFVNNFLCYKFLL